MKLRTIEQLWRDQDAVARLSRAALVPVSWLYGAVIWGRNRVYDSGGGGVARVDVPVICIGNLTVGGSGKTPAVMWLVAQLLARGLRPVVVARGYGGNPEQITSVSSPLPSRLPEGVRAVDAAEPAGGGSGSAAGAVAGDEAVLIARRAGVPVVTGADRTQACRMAIAMFDADIIVLDDGFQHRRLRRDLDVVIVNTADRRARLLPAGPLREPLSSLERADFVIDTGRGAPPGSITMEGVAEALVAEVARDAAQETVGRLSGARVLAVAGIARPQRFLLMLGKLGARLVDPVLFEDHHSYTATDWDAIVRRAAGVDLVVTTEKDLVKLEAFVSPESVLPLRALRYGVTVHGGEAILQRIGQFDAGRIMK